MTNSTPDTAVDLDGLEALAKGAGGDQKWSAKNEVLLVGAHKRQQYNEAVVVGDPDSNELVALTFGYSPEGCDRRAKYLAAANPATILQLVALARRTASAEAGIKEVIVYLRALSGNLLRNNCDMQIDACEDPDDVADRLEALLTGASDHGN